MPLEEWHGTIHLGYWPEGLGQFSCPFIIGDRFATTGLSPRLATGSLPTQAGSCRPPRTVDGLLGELIRPLIDSTDESRLGLIVLSGVAFQF